MTSVQSQNTMNARCLISLALGLPFSAPLIAVEAPKIVAGDYLLVYARIVDCGSGLQAIEAGHVDEEGVVIFFGNVALVARNRAVYAVRNELVDVTEDKTGHRSESLELIYVSGRDKEAVTRRLMKSWTELKHTCSRIVLPAKQSVQVPAFGAARVVGTPLD